MNGFIQNIINRIDAGESVNLGSNIKNSVNAAMAKRLNIGDEVEIVSSGKVTTGMTGTVVGKVEYDRTFSDCFSPNGYTAIKVKTVSGTHNYAGRNLKLKHRKETGNGK